jgi:hypothetical protein
MKWKKSETFVPWARPMSELERELAILDTSAATTRYMQRWHNSTNIDPNLTEYYTLLGYKHYAPQLLFESILVKRDVESRKRWFHNMWIITMPHIRDSDPYSNPWLHESLLLLIWEGLPESYDNFQLLLNPIEIERLLKSGVSDFRDIKLIVGKTIFGKCQPYADDMKKRFEKMRTILAEVTTLPDVLMDLIMYF